MLRHATILICWVLWGTIWVIFPDGLDWKSINNFPTLEQCEEYKKANEESGHTLTLPVLGQDGTETVHTRARQWQCLGCGLDPRE